MAGCKHGKRTMTETKGYIFELRESDGNDCTVYDAIVEADSSKQALALLADDLDSRAKAKDWESDGNYGYFFPCDCEQPGEPLDELPCDSCATLRINGVVTHETGCPRWAEYKRALRQFESFECPGHGGLTVATEPNEFVSFDAAWQEHREHRYYHSVLQISR